MVLDAIATINLEIGTTTAVITHNTVIGGMADRVVHVADGRIASVQRNATREAVRQLAW